MATSLLPQADDLFSNTSLAINAPWIKYGYVAFFCFDILFIFQMNM
jgi:hypothetical protein